MNPEQDSNRHQNADINSLEELIAELFPKLSAQIEHAPPPPAEHIPEEVLEESYEALYRNIGYWVSQAEEITNVPDPDFPWDDRLDPEEEIQ